MNVAVILNTTPHVETLLFLYLALDRLEGIKPVAFPLDGDRWGLKALLEKGKIRYSFHTEGMRDHFDAAVVITAYPSGIDLPALPFARHPFLKEFSGRRILITHRANAPLSRYESTRVLCLHPAGQNQGVPHLFPCEHPLLGAGMELSPGSTIRLLVQGKFDRRHRELSLISAILKQFPQGIHIVLLGSGASLCGFKDPRVTTLENLNEVEFYEAAASCHYMLPLVDGTTLKGSYIHERFSSSLGISFADLKPSIVHESLQGVYSFPLGHIYRDLTELMEILQGLTEGAQDYPGMREQMRMNRDFMRLHNEAVLSDALQEATSPENPEASVLTEG
ncbi:hypothetical protein [Luteolibacter luteus]|uniref:Glycosyltransferase family 1 protein n=1 Tax=Luteolibacter luteus TaxID=2728835 RepID=A0A858RNR7_9BACT|nr:hypothetical protein [Luteolibacter luteus]QJE97583.1 hypothetical protein HHL09_17955 [Luteolibacter luteus]